MRAARAWHDWQGAKFCRFGDNMRQVAVTEGDKVAAEMTFGFSTNGYGVGELAAAVDDVSDAEAKDLAGEYEERYTVAPELRRGGERHESLLYGARLELGLRAFLREWRLQGLHRHFRGFARPEAAARPRAAAPDGGWATASAPRATGRRRRCVRAMKVMGEGLPRGTSFMEDYTYHLGPGGGPGPRLAHARGLSVDRDGQALARNSSAGDRRQGGSRFAWCSTRRPDPALNASASSTSARASA